MNKKTKENILFYLVCFPVWLVIIWLGAHTFLFDIVAYGCFGYIAADCMLKLCNKFIEKYWSQND